MSSKQKKVTLLFPGQGSQYPGMGKEFHENFQSVQGLYRRASEVVGYSMEELCFRKSNGNGNGNSHALNRTVFTQPAVFTTGYACYQAFRETCVSAGLEVDVSMVAGHSLGEYTALVVAGAMDFETGLALVQRRADYMTEVGRDAAEAGLMAIVNRNGGLDFHEIWSLCKRFQVHITLNNTRRQIVVGGPKEKLTEMAQAMNGADTRTTMLNVEGPFHTPLMKPAADMLLSDLEKCRMSIASRPVISNVSTQAIVDPGHIKQELYDQIFQVVDWRHAMEKAVEKGSDVFIEIGPKKVLTNMLRDIDPTVSSANVDTMESLGSTIGQLQGGRG
jgi:[acyl-carrier-protein] S-malonyltransferase